MKHCVTFKLGIFDSNTAVVHHSVKPRCAKSMYRLGPVNSNTVNPKFHLNQSFYLSLLFHV